MREPTDGAKLLMRYCNCSFDDLKQNGVSVRVGLELARAIDRKIRREAWTAFNMLNNGLTVGGMKEFYGAPPQRRRRP